MFCVTPKEFECLRAFWERRASATTKLPTDINRLPAEQSIKWEDYCCERYVISKGTYKSPTKTAILTALQIIGRMSNDY